MDYIYAVLFFCLINLGYLSFFLGIAYKKISLCVTAYLCVACFYDYIFINASYYLPQSFVALTKPISEYFLLCLIIYGIFKIIRKKGFQLNVYTKRVISLLLVPSLIVLFSADIIHGNEVGDIIQGLRFFIIPIIIPWLMARYNLFDQVSYKNVGYTIVFLAVTSVVYGIYQKYTFNGNIETLWFYDFFNKMDENPVEIGSFNFIRDDKIRVTSWYVSPIIYSLSLAIAFVYIISKLFLKRLTAASYLFYTLVSIFFLFGIFESQTRIGLFVAMLSLMVLLLRRTFRFSIPYWIYLIAPLSAIVVTCLSLILGFTEDLSALGRLKQYASIMLYFYPSGNGFGAASVLSFFDSYYLSLMSLYGVFFVFPLAFLFFCSKKLFICAGRMRSYTHYFIVATFIIALTFIYTFAFQFTAGSYIYKLFFFMVFFSFSKSEKLNPQQH